MEKSHQNINLAEFLSVCIFVSEECGKVIRQVESSGDLKTVTKVEGPVTVADLRVQQTIETCLTSLYPTLRIQGEESKESIKDVQPAVKPDQISDALKKFVSTEFLNKHHTQRQDFINNSLKKTYGADEVQSELFETFNTQDAIVWVDPLDGTSDFVKGNLPAVTVLIGLSIAGKSRAGIVHNPFSFEDQTQSLTYFGTAEHGVYKLNYNIAMTAEESVKREIHYLPPFDHFEVPADDHKIRVAASLQHFSQTMQEIIETISPVEIVRLGGAGNKCNNLAIGTVDSYIHPSPGLHYWDLCAPESLIKGMGGYSTNLAQERLTYPLESDHKIRGLILARNPPMYKAIERRMGDVLKKILTTVKL